MPFDTHLNFRVDWGYQFVYSRRQYHPQYCWDGEISCSSGEICAVYQLEYPYSWWGPVHSARERPLSGKQWQSTTRRGIAGIRVVARCGSDGRFKVSTQSGDFEFTAEDVLQKGRIVFPVGWKYSHCTVIVSREGFHWFRRQPQPLETVVEAKDMRAGLVNWSRMKQVWVESGASVTFNVCLPEITHDGGQPYWHIHLQAMTAKNRQDPFALARDYMPMELRENGRSLASMRQYFRFHDMSEQILHDVWAEIPYELLTPGTHTLALINQHATLPLLVNRISFRPRERNDLECIVPRWAIAGQEAILRVQTQRKVRLALDYSATDIRFLNPPDPAQEFEPGNHEFRFTPLFPQLCVGIRVTDVTHGTEVIANIDAVYDLPPETIPVKVGYDMTTVPHDDSGTMDWLLDYTHRTQLGNLVCFRPFPMGWTVDDALLDRWGRYCSEHQIYVQGINLDAGPLPAAAGDYFQGIGRHELSSAVYFDDPDNKSSSMKNAAERYIAYIREHVEKTRALAPRVSFGDASGGHRYSLLAGADFLRAETMVANTMHHLSQARAAAQSLGSGEWGVHIAMQHPKQPYLESHLGQYYLSMMQAWMMGASFIYEEDSLFVMFKEERQCWNDLLTRGKRRMTREFYRFATTHPRIGQPEIRIACLQGRYAAPFNGFICGSEQDPQYSVWGKFGRSDVSSWGHCQPEKAQQLLDILMPGASTHPLRQQFDMRRFFFAGTPYGDFDQAPVESNLSFLVRYKLLLHLGWNTMLKGDYEELLNYVSQGGTLLLGVPQLSTHEGRDFLPGMDDLALYENGRIESLCGVRILRRGEVYSGTWESTDPLFDKTECPKLSRAPSNAPDEDGPCHIAEIELHGANVCIRDKANGKPLLVSHTLGTGTVYLLTTWAYPGHEQLSDLSGAIISKLCQLAVGNYHVHDRDNETFWTWWPHPEFQNCGKLMLLNTDWTVADNQRTVSVRTPIGVFDTFLKERVALIITCLPFIAVVPENPEPHIEIVQIEPERAVLRIHGTGTHRFALRGCNAVGVILDDKEAATTNGTFEITWNQKTVVECILSTRHH